MTLRDPILHPVSILDLRPTQITVGLREVEQKRKAWRARANEDEGDFLGRHMIPTVIGPKKRHYIIDHHHLALALHEEKVERLLVNPLADLSALPAPMFWNYMDNRAWCHPYDENGVRRSFDEIPQKVTKLADDPYRSLAGELRRAGGFAKDTTPFSEFLWADFLRPQIKRKQIEGRFTHALTKAVVLARSEAAAYLPGWCGPHAD